MKKRLISLFVALTMLLCLIPAAFAATFNAGTYTASANGMNGAVTVEVTFSDSAITDVKVTEQAETPAIAPARWSRFRRTSWRIRRWRWTR